MIADDFELRWYKYPDANRLVELLRTGFPCEEWAKKDFDRFLNNKSGRNNVIKVLAAGTELYGAILYTVEATSIRVRRVVVRPDVRRQGLAAFMLNSLCGPRSPVRRRAYHARVRENDIPAIKLLKEKMGFVFDPNKAREHDPERKVDYYEFTLVKPAIVPSGTPA